MSLRKKKGSLAEKIAADYLKSQGFKIKDRNFYTKWGEIDIIAEKNGQLHFIEVRSGSNKDFNPALSVTKKKISHLVKAIHIYLKKSAWYGHYRAHLISVRYFNEKPKIEFIEDFIELD